MMYVPPFKPVRLKLAFSFESVCVCVLCDEPFACGARVSTILPPVGIFPGEQVELTGTTVAATVVVAGYVSPLDGVSVIVVVVRQRLLTDQAANDALDVRSEERRGGKECRSRG